MAARASNIQLRSEIDLYLFHLVVPIERICSETERTLKVFVPKDIFELLMKMGL